MDDHENPRVEKLEGEWDSAAHEPVESISGASDGDAPQVPRSPDTDAPEESPAQPATDDWPFSEPLPADDPGADARVTVATEDEEPAPNQPAQPSGPT